MIHGMETQILDKNPENDLRHDGLDLAGLVEATADRSNHSQGSYSRSSSVERSGGKAEDLKSLTADSAGGLAKEVAKKKRASKTAKLKQTKLDVRRGQWLAQVSGGKALNAGPPQQQQQEEKEEEEEEVKRGKEGKPGLGANGHVKLSKKLSISSAKVAKAATVVVRLDEKESAVTSSTAPAGAVVAVSAAPEGADEEEEKDSEASAVDDSWEASAIAKAVPDTEAKAVAAKFSKAVFAGEERNEGRQLSAEALGSGTEEKARNFSESANGSSSGQGLVKEWSSQQKVGQVSETAAAALPVEFVLGVNAAGKQEKESTEKSKKGRSKLKKGKNLRCEKTTGDEGEEKQTESAEVDVKGGGGVEVGGREGWGKEGEHASSAKRAGLANKKKKGRLPEKGGTGAGACAVADAVLESNGYQDKILRLQDAAIVHSGWGQAEARRAPEQERAKVVGVVELVNGGEEESTTSIGPVGDQVKSSKQGDRHKKEGKREKRGVKGKGGGGRPVVDDAEAKETLVVNEGVKGSGGSATAGNGSVGKAKNGMVSHAPPPPPPPSPPPPEVAGPVVPATPALPVFPVVTATKGSVFEMTRSRSAHGRIEREMTELELQLRSAKKKELAAKMGVREGKKAGVGGLPLPKHHQQQQEQLVVVVGDAKQGEDAMCLKEGNAGSGGMNGHSVASGTNANGRFAEVPECSGRSGEWHFSNGAVSIEDPKGSIKKAGQSKKTKGQKKSEVKGQVEKVQQQAANGVEHDGEQMKDRRAGSGQDGKVSSSSSSASSSSGGSGSEENGRRGEDSAGEDEEEEDDWEAAADAMYLTSGEFDGASAVEVGEANGTGDWTGTVRLNNGDVITLLGKEGFVPGSKSLPGLGPSHGRTYELQYVNATGCTVSVQGGTLRPEYKYNMTGIGFRSRSTNGRAWRPDDVARPDSLPPPVSGGSGGEDAHAPGGGRAVSKLSGSAWQAGGGNSLASWGGASPPPPSFCPICTEELDMTDSSFVPCSCGFRLCLFCHHRIASDDGRCPGCRKEYTSEAANPKLPRPASLWLRV
eukprot:jgi/Mesen1/10134/ME000075S09639